MDDQEYEVYEELGWWTIFFVFIFICAGIVVTFLVLR